MQIMCTGDPDVITEGESIVISFPSGDGTMRASISLHQAMMLRHLMTRGVHDALDAPERESAEVVPFKRKKRRARHGKA